MRCSACGYDRSYHPDDACPLCACGKLPAEHGSLMTPPAPLRRWPDDPPTLVELDCCPGKAPSEKTGRYPHLRRGAFRPPPAAAATRDWFGMTVPLTEAELVARVEQVTDRDVIERPQVAARSPQGPQEIAGGTGNKQAVKMGRAAASGGWRVAARFWRAHAGAEGCAVTLTRGTARAVAFWARPDSGASWKTDDAYAWDVVTPGSFTKVNHTKLGEMIK